MDFTGFTFNGIHSSTFKILRVSNGDRYEESLTPDFENRTIDIEGRNGQIYNGFNYGPKDIPISLAFDSMTELDLRKFRNWITIETPSKLVFDEWPYKTYIVKIDGAPSFNYICFDQNGERIYKGECEFTFVCFDGFAKCSDESYTLSTNGKDNISGKKNWQNIKTYNLLNTGTDNVTEWGRASGLIDISGYNQFSYVTENNTSYYKAKLYNPGDREVAFQLYIGSAVISTSQINIQIVEGEYTTTSTTTSTPYGTIGISEIASGDLFLDSGTHIIKNKESGKIKLRYDLFKEGKWFKIKPGVSTILISGLTGLDLTETPIPIYIKYDYQYC